MTAPNVIFVCWGNICRSPMAEVVARRWAARSGVDAVFTSAGVSSEEEGNPMDPRAVAVLRRAGYPLGEHAAHRITAAEVREAALVVAMEDIHLDRMRRLVPDATNLRLLTDFDPTAEPGSGVPDPWYGSAAGFADTLSSIEAAMPELLDQVREFSTPVG